MTTRAEWMAEINNLERRLQSWADEEQIWVERELALVAERDRLLERVAELESKHPEWMKRIQQERKEERERLWEEMETHWRGDMGPAYIYVKDIEALFKID